MNSDHNTANKDKSSGIVEYLLTHYRGWFATFILLPISVVFDLYSSMRNYLIFSLRSAPGKHPERVAAVQRQILYWKASGAKQKLCTARSGWKATSDMVPHYKYTDRQIDVNLYDILEINEEKCTVRVQPLVNMGQLTAALLPLGWTIPVVPELDALTVGGLVMGFGIESSSHKYGLFQYICVSYDIVTADGELIHCSPNENPDLYHAIPWSYGTLGFLVAAEIQMIRASNYVKIQYQPLHSAQEIRTAFETACRDKSNDFVELLMYSRDSGVLMIGHFSNGTEQKLAVNRIGRWYKPWFFSYVKKLLEKRQRHEELIPLRHYYHRHTRSLFWEMGEVIPFGNHPVFRFLLGWALPPKMQLLKYTETETTRRLRNKHHMVQDMLMPMEMLDASLDYFDQRLCIYPLWLSPMAVYANEKDGGFLRPYYNKNGAIDEMFVDIGAYGSVHRPVDAEEEQRKLEQFVIDHKGYQAMYAKTLMDEDSYRKMFDHRLYDRLRSQMPYCTQAFKEVYEKVSLKGRSSPVDIKKMKKT